jgi:hypothetical protein
MYCVVKDKVYSATFDEANNRYPLVSVAIGSDGAITVTDEGDGVAVLPAGYLKCTIEEVIAIFGLEAGEEYEPPATITGNDPVTVYLDEASKAVTLAASNPSAGAFSGVKSSDTGVATVSAVGGTITIVPVALGTCDVTITFTPTDTDFAASEITIPVTVAKRKIEFAPVRDQNLTKNVAKTIVLEPNVSGVTYTVTSSDTNICTVAITGTAGHENDLVLTPSTTILGKCKICVSAVDENGKADDSDVMCFWVNVCNTAVSITAIDDQTLEVGATKEITVVCAGAEIREVKTSDPTIVTVEKSGKLKLKITGVGEAEDTATITVYCDKRGYGEDSEDFTVTLTAAT